MQLNHFNWVFINSFAFWYPSFEKNIGYSPQKVEYLFLCNELNKIE